MFSKRIEDVILNHLYAMHSRAEALKDPDLHLHIRASRLLLFNLVNAHVGPVSSSKFNAIVENMRLVGLLGATHRGAHFLFLTDQARQIFLDSLANKGGVK